MFTKEQRKAYVQSFWLQFDQYCDTLPDLRERKKKWILHDTKISHIDLKFDIDHRFAMVALEINHNSENRRLRVFELIERYRILLEEGFVNGLTWDFCYLNSNNQQVCRIYIKLGGVDLYLWSDRVMIYPFLARNMQQLQDNFLEIQEALLQDVNILNRED